METLPSITRRSCNRPTQGTVDLIGHSFITVAWKSNLGRFFVVRGRLFGVSPAKI
jgi:hypothetical protein